MPKQKKKSTFDRVWKQELSPSEKLVAMFALGQAMDIGFEMLGVWNSLWATFRFAATTTDDPQASTAIKKEMFLMHDDDGRVDHHMHLLPLSALNDLKKDIEKYSK